MVVVLPLVSDPQEHGIKRLAGGQRRKFFSVLLHFSEHLPSTIPLHSILTDIQALEHRLDSISQSSIMSLQVLTRASRPTERSSRKTAVDFRLDLVFIVK